MKPPKTYLPFCPDDSVERKITLTTKEKQLIKRMDGECKRLFGERSISRARYWEKRLAEKEETASAALARQLSYLCGYYYEHAATHEETESSPRTRAHLFEKAVAHYQRADDIIGSVTDIALRQSEACAGAAVMRDRAGMSPAITQAYRERATLLLEHALGTPVIVVNREDVPLEMRVFAEKVEESAGTRLYVGKDRTEEGKRN